MTESKKIILIDGSGYIFRAYYAIQRLSTSKGFPTNAILGFVNMLAKVLEVEKPSKLMIAFDTAKPTFRKQQYEHYKSNRQAPPEDLVRQIPLIHRAVDCFAIKRMEMEGFEADDILGTVAKKAEREGFLVEIITGDKDLAQLVTEKITLYDTLKERRLNPEGVKEKFGVTPAQIVDFLALMGDSSDNIPGITGIGEKTAMELIREHGSLEGIYENLEKLSPKRREVLVKERDIAFLSRSLAQIQCEMNLQIDWSDFSYVGPDLEKLGDFCSEFEFQALIKRFDLKPPERTLLEGTYETVRTESRLRSLVEELSHAPCVALDTETTSLRIHSADLVGVSLSAKTGNAYYIPLGHTLLGALDDTQLSKIIAKQILKPFLENPKISKVGQNFKFDLQILRKWGVDVRGFCSDTMVMSYLINPDNPHNLDSLAFRYLGHQNITYSDVTGSGKTQINFSEVSIDKATQYAAEDADVTLQLHKTMMEELQKNGAHSLYHEIEVPLIEILADMEFRGILVDRERLTEISVLLASELAKMEKVIYQLAGEPFNINSPKQLSRILFDKLQLPTLKKTKTGFSTDESVLAELCKDHEICAWIVKYRELAKLKSTYAEGLLSEAHPDTGRIHTHYNQTVTATGRLSSSEPNLQNIPADSPLQYDVRRAFIAPDGYSFFSADYSQIELRLLAHMSQDPELLRAFKDDEDVHDHTARLVFGEKEVTPEARRIAKTINFGIMYGQTPFGLSQSLRIPPKEAKVFIDRFFERYVGVQCFLQKIIEDARKNGYVTTLLGRRRYLPDLNSQNRMKREMAERAAINAPVQGTAADLIKKAMVCLYHNLKSERLKSHMILQVHDELVLEVLDNEREKVTHLVKEAMESALPLSVPLKIQMGWGKNWRECSV